MKRNCETPKTRPFSSFDRQRYSSNSTHQETNLKLISALRSRHSPSDLQVNSELASKVVRQYILPLFNQDCKDKSLEKRRKSIGIKHRKQIFSTYDGTLYTELKLSDQLALEVKAMSQELESTTKASHETKQKLFTIESELQQCKDQLNLEQCNVKSLISDNLALQSFKNIHIDPTSSITHQVIVYKALISQLTKEKQDLSKSLQEEKAINDIR